MSAPVLLLRDVTRVHGSGDAERARAARRRPHRRRRRAGRRDGPVRLRQVDAADLAGGLDSPTAGTVLVEGTDLAGLSPRRAGRRCAAAVGYVFQDFNLIPALTAAENVALPRELDGDPRRRGPPAGAGRARGGRPRRARRPLPRRDVRRPAAAGRHRPRAGRRPPAGARRRADRRAGLRDRRVGAAAAARPLRRRRRRGAGHPRGPARGLGRPGRLPARRRRRRPDRPARRRRVAARRRRSASDEPTAAPVRLAARALRIARREALRAPGPQRPRARR